MSQNFIDDFYSSTGVVDTDMSKAEVNFAALKSSFSGIGAPANPFPGMWWFDTSLNLLKLRNETNNAWQSVWNFANNKPVISNLSNDITLAMLNSAIKDPSATLLGLRTLGTGAAQACAGNDERIFSDYLAGNVVIGKSDFEIKIESTTTNEITKVKEFDVLRAGEYRIGWEYKSALDHKLAYTYLYRNDVLLASYSTYDTIYKIISVDKSGWEIGDKISIRADIEHYLPGNSAIYLQNAKVSVAVANRGMPSWSIAELT